jgi:hypothetical protein
MGIEVGVSVGGTAVAAGGVRVRVGLGAQPFTAITVIMRKVTRNLV